MREEIWAGIKRHIQPIGGQEHAEIIEVRPGYARLSVEVTKEALNLYGKAHGGFLFSLCDIAAGISTYAYEVSNVTLQSSINFVKEISAGTIYITSESIHRGRRTVVNQVTITSEDEKVLASAQFTMFITGEL